MNAISISDVAIRQTSDNLYSLNDLHKASGGREAHKPNNWLRSQQAQELIAEIQAEGKVAVQTSQGGKNRGTFVCKELVYAYATWISAKFFLQVIRTFDAVVSGSLKTQTAKLGCLTLEQQDEIKKFHRELVQSAPKDKQAALAIGLWSAVKTKFGVGYKQVAEAHYPEVLSLMARVAVEKGAALNGEVLDKENLPSESEFKALIHMFAKLGTYTLTLRDLQKNLMLKPENLSYWFSNLTNAPEEGFLFFFNPDINRDLDDAANIIRRHKHLIA